MHQIKVVWRDTGGGAHLLDLGSGAPGGLGVLAYGEGMKSVGGALACGDEGMIDGICDDLLISQEKVYEAVCAGYATCDGVAARAIS